MQKQIHPNLPLTLIRHKDGTFTNKHWLYFREILQLEIDVTSNSRWEKKGAVAPFKIETLSAETKVLVEYNFDKKILIIK